MRIDSTQLESFLIDTKLVSRTKLEELHKEAEKGEKDFEELLLASGSISEDDLRRAKAHILGIPFVDLKDQKIEFALLSLIPEPIARNNNIVAYSQSPKGLEVAMLDVDDLQAIDFVKKKTGLTILPRLTDTESVKRALIQYQKSLKAEFGDIISTEAQALTAIADMPLDGEGSSEDLKKLAEDLPIVRIVDTLIKHAVVQGASDIHIEPAERQLMVRYRIDGLLHDAMTLPKQAAPGIVARIKVLSSLKLDEKRLPQDGRFKIDLDGEKVSFRVSTLPTYYGEKIVMRILRESGGGFTLESLGFHGEGIESLHWSVKQATGMLLTTGPTGSGKTTTLYTLLDILNTPDVNISTIEDPVEYQMPRINQTQVKPEIGMTFGNGLRALVRQDPDIIMVGEIRDQETASLAVNAALTGHLVLSTLHTNSAAGAIPRMIDMDVEPFLLVSTIKVIIGQRLVRTLAKEKEEYKLSKDELKLLASHIDLDRMLAFLKAEKVVAEKADWGDIPFYRPKGGADSDDGYKGRLGIHEVMRMTSTIKDLIIKGGTADAIEAQAKSEGMMTMLEDGVFKAVQGTTTLEEVLRVVSE
ncbi:MAG: Flp pilus assembly complex ATPase component TadA [Candidatus Pacebacteria bacterium]|nr:Flp pilus assembly complex ATPase component TadA [Candidatus Paceibacterota bacterium]